MTGCAFKSARSTFYRALGNENQSQVTAKTSKLGLLSRLFNGITPIARSIGFEIGFPGPYDYMGLNISLKYQNSLHCM